MAGADVVVAGDAVVFGRDEFAGDAVLLIGAAVEETGDVVEPTEGEEVFEGTGGTEVVVEVVGGDAVEVVVVAGAEVAVGGTAVVVGASGAVQGVLLLELLSAHEGDNTLHANDRQEVCREDPEYDVMPPVITRRWE